MYLYFLYSLLYFQLGNSRNNYSENQVQTQRSIFSQQIENSANSINNNKENNNNYNENNNNYNENNNNYNENINNNKENNNNYNENNNNNKENNNNYNQNNNNYNEINDNTIIKESQEIKNITLKNQVIKIQRTYKNYKRRIISKLNDFIKITKGELFQN